MKKNVILISYDAFSEDNWELAKEQPNLKKLISQGAYTNQMESVYPTLTYVVHTTVVTGNYPEKHGIYHNNPVQPFVKEKDQEWFWSADKILGTTIYKEANRLKYKVASLLWPVTAKAKINYNIPEVRAIHKENQAIKVVKNGSPFYTLFMELRNGSIRQGITQPFLDNYTNQCAIDTIKTKNASLIMLHLIDLDDHKHNCGTKSNEVSDVIVRMDQRIGALLEAVEKTRKSKDTIFVVFGDHGQIDVSYKVRLNCLLKEAGLIYQKDGKMEYLAYLQSTGGSAYLHIKNQDREIEAKALEIIQKAMSEDIYGIEKIIGSEELGKLRGPKITNYMIEAKVGYSFLDDLKGDVIVDLKKRGKVYATHGYLPSKPKYRCNLLISGEGIKSNYFIEQVEMVDIAPTISHMMGFDFPCDGRVLQEIFE